MGRPRKGAAPTPQPEVQVSRVFPKNGWYHIDLRGRNGGRPVIRNPDALGWPDKGERTRDEETARQWARVYDARWQKEQEEAARREAGQFPSLAFGTEHFLEERKRVNAPSTYSGSCTATAHLLEWVGPDVDPTEVTGADLQAMFNSFIDEEYAPSSLHNIRNHLRALFRHMEIDPNPAHEVKLPRQTQGDIVPWNERQRNRIREVADQIDVERGDTSRTRRRLVECLFSMGLRIQEAAALRWENINPSTMIVRISRQIARSTNAPAMTKGGAARSVTVLQEWWDVHDENALGLIVAQVDGTAIPYRKLYDLVCEILTRAGTKEPGVAAHYFRHTYAFIFLDRGGTLDHLSKSLGHKKLSTTQKYYEHFTSDDAARAAARLIYRAGSTRRGSRKKR